MTLQWAEKTIPLAMELEEGCEIKLKKPPTLKHAYKNVMPCCPFPPPLETSLPLSIGTKFNQLLTILQNTEPTSISLTFS
jgi:hypothetical protein